jgi:hypothetical protein
MEGFPQPTSRMSQSNDMTKWLYYGLAIVAVYFLYEHFYGKKKKKNTYTYSAVPQQQDDPKPTPVQVHTICPQVPSHDGSTSEGCTADIYAMKMNETLRRFPQF